MNQIVLVLGLFPSVKGHLCLTKGHLDNSEGQVEVKSSLPGSYFWDFWFKLTKSFFSKAHFLIQLYTTSYGQMFNSLSSCIFDVWLSTVSIENVHVALQLQTSAMF